jgi:hypothetical protein
MAVLQFDNMFNAFSDSNEKSWKYDRNASVGASEAFDCIRKAHFKKFQYAPDDGHEQDWGAAKRGDLIENHFAVPAVKAILPEGAELLYAGEEQETLKKGRLSATPDGLAVGLDWDALQQLGVEDIESDCVVIEFKSFDPRANIKEAKEVHVGQTQVQMGLIHELTEFRPEYAVVIYFNASWLSDIKPFVVKRDPKIYAAAVQRAKMVFATDNPADLMAEGKISGACNLCEFTEECAFAQGEATPKTKRKVEDQETLDRLALLSARSKEYGATAKDAEHNRKVTDEEIKDLLRKADTKGAGDDRFSISLSWCSGKKSLDTLALAVDLEEKGMKIEDYQREGNGYERLTVKVKDAAE